MRQIFPHYSPKNTLTTWTAVVIVVMVFINIATILCPDIQIDNKITPRKICGTMGTLFRVWSGWRGWEREFRGIFNHNN